VGYASQHCRGAGGPKKVRPSRRPPEKKKKEATVPKLPHPGEQKAKDASPEKRKTEAIRKGKGGGHVAIRNKKKK